MYPLISLITLAFYLHTPPTAAYDINKSLFVEYMKKKSSGAKRDLRPPEPKPQLFFEAKSQMPSVCLFISLGYVQFSLNRPMDPLHTPNPAIYAFTSQCKYENISKLHCTSTITRGTDSPFIYSVRFGSENGENCVNAAKRGKARSRIAKRDLFHLALNIRLTESTNNVLLDWMRWPPELLLLKFSYPPFAHSSKSDCLLALYPLVIFQPRHIPRMPRYENEICDVQPTSVIHRIFNNKFIYTIYMPEHQCHPLVRDVLRKI